MCGSSSVETVKKHGLNNIVKVIVQNRGGCGVESNLTVTKKRKDSLILIKCLSFGGLLSIRKMSATM